MGAVFDHKAWAAKSDPVVYGDLAVGDITQLNVDGAATDFIVVHQGKPSSLYDDSCDGTWLLLKDVYEQQQWCSYNTNDYANSTIHSYLNSTFLALFDSNIQSAINQVKIPYVNGTGSDGFIASGANGLNCKIFLLAGYEVGLTTSNNPEIPVDGAKLDYFESGTGATVLAKRIAEFTGSQSTWWLRSPYTGGSMNAWQVQKTGGVGHRRATTTGGVRPCFIMPSNQKIFS